MWSMILSACLTAACVRLFALEAALSVAAGARIGFARHRHMLLSLDTTVVQGVQALLVAGRHSTTGLCCCLWPLLRRCCCVCVCSGVYRLREVCGFNELPCSKCTVEEQNERTLPYESPYCWKPPAGSEGGHPLWLLQRPLLES